MTYTEQSLKLIRDGFDEYEDLVDEKSEVNSRFTDYIKQFVGRAWPTISKKQAALLKKKVRKYVTSWYSVMTSKEPCTAVVDARRDDMEVPKSADDHLSNVCNLYKKDQDSITEINTKINGLVEAVALRVSMDKSALKSAYSEYKKMKKGNSKIDEVSSLIAFMEGENK